jgi:protein associated with RNAse G/E
VSISTEITIKSYKYDGKPHRSWKCELVEQKEDMLILLGEFDTEIVHPHLGVIKPGTLSYEYYWLDRWYNVFRFHEPDGSFRNFYCNINMPPEFDGGVLSYVDLDIDIFVSKDFETAVWDMDEFEENISLYNYPPEVIAKTEEAVEALRHLIENRKFPFEEGANRV